MKGNIRYREGVGKNINNSIRLGVNKVLDCHPDSRSQPSPSRY
jgi:hypothetical protein